MRLDKRQPTMRAVRLHEHGGPDVLRVEEIDRPTPGEDELLVEVEAAGVNPVDTYFREGSYAPASLPFTPGVDYAGHVIECGTAVTSFDLGDRVFGTGIGNAEYQGAYAEYATVPVDRTVRLPAAVDCQQAGAAGVAALTSWRALIDHAGLRPAETCLVHGGSGGVGHTAVQIAAAVGARVITTAAPRYHEKLGDLGASHVFDYARDDLEDAIVSTTDRGVDVVLDHRLDDYLQFDAEVAATRGRVVGIGENHANAGFQDIGTARSKDVSFQFMSMFNTPDFRVALSGVAELMRTGALDISLHQTFDLDDAADAQRSVMNESFLGKLALRP